MSVKNNEIIVSENTTKFKSIFTISKIAKLTSAVRIVVVCENVFNFPSCEAEKSNLELSAHPLNPVIIISLAKINATAHAGIIVEL